MVSAWLFLVPTLRHLLGSANPPPAAVVHARLTHNLASQAGRVDFVPVRLVWREGEPWAEPVFGKSNQIFILVQGQGLVMIPRDANGLSAGEIVDVKLF
jgi:molybdopterin molybdotransferase